MSVVTPFRPADEQRVLPDNAEVEQRLLGAILIDNRAFDRVAGFLCADHFANALHGRIFAAIAQLVLTGTQANPVTLKHLFEQDEALKDNIGGGPYLARLATAAVTVSNAEDYARIIVDLAQRRAFIGALQDGLDAAYSANDLVDTVADLMARHVTRVDQIRSAAPDRLQLVSPTSWTGLPVPRREFVVTPWIPLRRATGFYGLGGTGKSTLIQMLCTACAIDDAHWLGLPVRRCRSVLLYCEDDEDEMHYRQDAINRLYGCTYDDLGDMLCLPRLGDDNVLMTFEQGRGIRTPLFHQLLTEAKAHGAQLAAFDTLSDVFAGNELDRHQAREFVQKGLSYFARQINGASLACAHPSLNGVSSGSGNSGSTGWPGAFRSHLYLEVPKPEQGEEPDPAAADARVLTRKKGNWAKPGETIEMRWKDDVFIRTPAPGSILGSIERRSAERVFLDLLDKATNEKRYVSESPNAATYAPRAFARRSDRGGYGIADFRPAMERLFAAGQIINVPYGPPSRTTFRITRGAKAYTGVP